MTLPSRAAPSKCKKESHSTRGPKIPHQHFQVPRLSDGIYASPSIASTAGQKMFPVIRLADLRIASSQHGNSHLCKQSLPQATYIIPSSLPTDNQAAFRPAMPVKARAVLPMSLSGLEGL